MKNIEQIIKNIEIKSKAIGFEQTSDRKVGALLATLCASKPQGTFLELGTGCGLSTVWMASGMDDDSTLTSVDNDKEVIAIAKEHLDDDKRITFVCSQGEDVIDTIEVSSVDLIFADTWPGKYNHLEETLALLKVGGMYIIDDMLAQDNWPNGHALKVEKLIDTLKLRSDLSVVEMHWASGVIVCTKVDKK